MNAIIYCRVSTEKQNGGRHERTLHQRSMAHPNQRLFPKQPGM